MCIAIFKAEGKVLSEETLRQCWSSNSDGAGFMFAEDNELKIHKGFLSLDEFLSAYEPHKEKKCVLHFRIKTHGRIDADNTHPFKVNGKLAFVHNGIIRGVHETHDEYSDTWHFNEQFIKPIVKRGPWMMDLPAIQMLISDFIGYSKLIFMNNKGEVTIYNEKAGVWDDECWYSNKSYEVKKKYLPAVPVPVPASNDSSPMPAMGDVVYTVAHYEDIPLNCYGKMAGYGENPFVWVDFGSNGGFKKLPAWAVAVSALREPPKNPKDIPTPFWGDDRTIFFEEDDAVVVTKNYGSAKVDDVGIVIATHRRACTVEMYNGETLIIPNRFLDLAWGN